MSLLSFFAGLVVRGFSLILSGKVNAKVFFLLPFGLMLSVMPGFKILACADLSLKRMAMYKLFGGMLSWK
jgi:hypothetical protein